MTRNVLATSYLSLMQVVVISEIYTTNTDANDVGRREEEQNNVIGPIREFSCIYAYVVAGVFLL